jgi:M6 family metalloprotease-like protein
MNMRKIFLSTLIALYGLLLMAAPHSFLPLDVSQPDGSQIRIYASGDEFHNWLHDEDNYTIVKDDAGRYVYAAQDGEKVAATALVVGVANPAQRSLAKGINLSERLIEAKYEHLASMRDYSNARSPHTGDFDNLVVYIRFSDSPNFMYPNSYYDNIFNNTAPNANSMKNYFLAASYDQLSVDSYFFPAPNGDVIVSYIDSHPRSYYQPLSPSNPNGYDEEDYWARTDREHTLLANASAHVASLIPGSINVDGDGDGYVDNVCFIIQGSPDGWAQLLWPHRWVLYGADAYIQGARVWDFNFQLESSLGSSGASVLAHEMFHSLGAPDLYRYNTTNITPIGSWDLMASNTNPPQHMSAWMKHRYGEWLPTPPMITESGTYTLHPVASSATNNAYRIQSWRSTDSYVLEYRKPHGLYDTTLPGQGLLVYRLNTGVEGNADGPPDELYIYRPNGVNNNTNGMLSRAAMSVQNNRTMMTESTNPSGFTTQDYPGGLYLYDVGHAGETITFSVRITDIQLSSPIGGETWFAGTTKPITWVARNSTGTVNIEFSSDGGNNWQTIATGAHNNGSYNWTNLPAVTSAQCYIRITHNASGHTDTSLQAFEIISELAIPEVLYPANGELNVPTNPLFDWSAVAGADSYHFQLSTDPEFSSTVMSLVNHGANSYQATGLSPFSTYYWRIAAAGEIGSSLYSEAYEFTTGPLSETPHVPQLLNPVNYASNQPRNAMLNWQASYLAESYWVQVSSNPFFSSIVFEAEGISNTFVETALLPGGSGFYWRVAAQNGFANSNFSGAFRFSTGDWVDSEDLLNPVAITALKQNRPNPFNPQTTINFSLKNPNSHASLKIFNTKGQMVRNLYSGIPGSTELNLVWDGRDDEGQALSSGIYLYRLENESKQLTRKMILSK